MHAARQSVPAKTGQLDSAGILKPCMPAADTMAKYKSSQLKKLFQEAGVSANL